MTITTALKAKHHIAISHLELDFTTDGDSAPSLDEQQVITERMMSLFPVVAFDASADEDERYNSIYDAVSDAISGACGWCVLALDIDWANTTEAI